MKDDRGVEVGSRTRRRPMGRDYAAAKDAEVGSRNKKMRPKEFGSKLGRWNLRNGF